MAEVLNYDIVVSSNLSHAITFTIFLILLPVMEETVSLLSFSKDDFGIK